MQRVEQTPVDIITGFLGSGKSTLLNRLLKHENLKDTAIIVNEIGEIGLDHLLVETQGQEIALIDGGCLCCSVSDSLPETLLALCSGRASGQLPPFKRIVIETTGLADPAPVTEVIRRSPLLGHFLKVGSVICTVDTMAGVAQFDNYVEVALQIAMADRLVLTKTDLCTDYEVLRQALIEANPFASLITVDEIDPETLFAPAKYDTLPPLASGGRHTHGIRTRHLIPPPEVSLSGIAAWIAVITHRWGADLIRCKGLVTGPRGRWLIQGVQGRYTFVTAPASTQSAADGLTVIYRRIPDTAFEPDLHWLAAAEGTLTPHPKDLDLPCSI